MRRHADAEGFTLIEVLVAFTIAVVLLLPLLRSFSSGIGSSTRTDTFTDATLIAESALESAGQSFPLTDGSNIEQQEGPYRVTTSVRRYAGEGTPQAPLLVTAPYEIAVTVSWQEAARTRSIALHTLRLGPPPPPPGNSP